MRLLPFLTPVLAGVLVIPPTVLAANLTGPRIIDSSRLDQAPAPAPAPGGAKPGGANGRSAVPADVSTMRFVLRDLRIDGVKSLKRADVAATWQGLRGKTIMAKDIYAIADRITALYGASGLALFAVSVPRQNFAGGVPRIEVIEGYVRAATIAGDTKGADLSLLQAYAAHIIAERPLRQATLERYILLMNDIPGLTVGNRLKPVPGSNGAEDLELAIKRKTYGPGVGIDNQGSAPLTATQANVSLAVNSVLQEGDRTQAVFGFPADWNRYQYYGLSHSFPVGTDGVRVGLNAGDLVTHPAGYADSGNAFLFGVQGSYPIIRAVNESWLVNGSFDVLNSDSAILGTSATDERTRAFRLGSSYAVLDGFQGIDRITATGSVGVDFLGARRGSIIYGEPGFTKLNLRLSRDQPLPYDFVVRGKVAGQVSPTRLPASEQFTFGGVDFGQAFSAVSLAGDEGLAAEAELAYKLPAAVTFSVFDGSELFGFVDWGEVWNRPTPYQVSTDRGASSGFGLHLNVLSKVSFTMAAATPIVQPTSIPAQERWRFVFGIAGAF